MIRYLKENLDGSFADVNAEDGRYSHILVSRGTYEELKRQIHAKIRVSEENLNAGLLRIMRERSNASRKISPKKDHDGYIALSMKEYEWRFKQDSGKGFSTNIWRSVIQTPYDAGLPFDSVRDYILEDLQYGGILSDLGCMGFVGPEYKGSYSPNKEEEKNNVMFNWNFSANFRSGMWEVEIFTTEPLTVFAERRPRQS